MLLPLSRSLVILVMASVVLWLLRAVSSSRVKAFGGSLVPVVRFPSSSMMLCWVCVAICVWSHFSKSAVMRVCVWFRSGVLVSWWSRLFLCALEACSWNRLSMSDWFWSVMCIGNGPKRR